LVFVEPDRFVVIPAYNPEYGLPDSYRAEVLGLVVVDRLPVKEAAARYNLSQSTVYKWLTDIKKGL
jgi:DNA-directed RNA polymerase specialized sigma24 family protein